MPTIAQVFDNKKLWKWWLQNNGNGTNPFNGVSEKGIDYSDVHGIAVAVPVGGTIVRIVHNNNSIGDVVEMRTTDGAVWLYQHIVRKVNVGDTLQCGSVIGTEDGLPRDQYSTGPHIEVRYCPPGKWGKAIDSWNEPWVDPKFIFSTIGGQQAGTVAAGNTSILGGLLGDPQTSTGIFGIAPTNISLSPNADVTLVLTILDELLAVGNPFDVGKVPTFDFTVGGGSALGVTLPSSTVSVPDPLTYIEEVSSNFVNDFVAVVWRMIFFALGLYILFKVAGNFIDFKAVGGTISQGVGAVVQGAALAA